MFKRGRFKTRPVLKRGCFRTGPVLKPPVLKRGCSKTKKKNESRVQSAVLPSATSFLDDGFRSNFRPESSEQRAAGQRATLNMSHHTVGVPCYAEWDAQQCHPSTHSTSGARTVDNQQSSSSEKLFQHVCEYLSGLQNTTNRCAGQAI